MELAPPVSAETADPRACASKLLPSSVTLWAAAGAVLWTMIMVAWAVQRVQRAQRVPTWGQQETVNWEREEASPPSEPWTWNSTTKEAALASEPWTWNSTTKEAVSTSEPWTWNSTTATTSESRTLTFPNRPQTLSETTTTVHETTTTTPTDPFLRDGSDELSYQEVLDQLPTNVLRTVDSGSPLFNPVYRPPEAFRFPDLMTRFDLIFGLEDTTTGWHGVPPQSFHDLPDPSELTTALVSPLHVEEFLLECEDHLNSSRSDRMLVFGVLEVPLSASFGSTSEARQQTMLRVGQFFDRVWYFSTDVVVPGVTTLPLGFFEPYMRGRSQQFIEAYRKASFDRSQKTGSILAAWGIYTQKNGSDIVQPPEPDPLGYGSTEWTAVAQASLDTRNDAEKWLTDASATDGLDVNVHVVPEEAWFGELSSHRFLLSPLGTAIQCSRLVEALAMLTVPIVKRGPFQTHDDLVDIGFPIVVVEHWHEITPDSLRRWWKELSPRLESFRRECLTSDGFWKIMTTGRCQAPQPSHVTFQQISPRAMALPPLQFDHGQAAA